MMPLAVIIIILPILFTIGCGADDCKESVVTNTSSHDCYLLGITGTLDDASECTANVFLETSNTCGDTLTFPADMCFGTNDCTFASGEDVRVEVSSAYDVAGDAVRNIEFQVTLGAVAGTYRMGID